MANSSSAGQVTRDHAVGFIHVRLGEVLNKKYRDKCEKIAYSKAHLGKSTLSTGRELILRIAFRAFVVPLLTLSTQ